MKQKILRYGWAGIYRSAVIMAFAQKRGQKRWNSKALLRHAAHQGNQRQFEVISQKIVRKGWLHSLKGPRGGFRVTDGLGDGITAADIFREFGSDTDKAMANILAPKLSKITPAALVAILDRHRDDVTVKTPEAERDAA